MLQQVSSKDSGVYAIIIESQESDVPHYVYVGFASGLGRMQRRVAEHIRASQDPTKLVNSILSSCVYEMVV